MQREQALEETCLAEQEDAWQQRPKGRRLGEERRDGREGVAGSFA